MTSILLIEDDTDIASSLSALLELYDVDVIGVGSNGKEGYELYKKLRPDAILLDVIMPQYNGIYALEKIRAEDTEIPICVVTGTSDPDTISQLKKFNATSIFFKPFEIDKIVTEINNHIKCTVNMNST